MMKLTPTEQLYLDALKQHPDGVRADVLLELRVPQKRESNIVDSHIKNLRKKLPKKYEIETVRGSGYRLVER